MAIYDLTGTAAGFINEWESASPTVTAHTSGSTGAPKQVQLKKPTWKCQQRPLANSSE